MVWMASCNDKVICPAFQSYYVHDDTHREQMFAYFGEDSLPSSDLPTARRNKNGLGYRAPVFAYRIKEAGLRTVPMEEVMPDEIVEIDSLTPVDKQYIAELKGDSTLLASADTIPTVRERPTGPGGRPMRINNDQHFYNRRYYEQLANPVPPPVPMRKLPKEMRKEAKKAKKAQKDGGFLSKLFGSGKAELSDSLSVEGEVEVEAEPTFVPFEEEGQDGGGATEEEDDGSEF